MINNILTILLESISYLVCLHCVFKKKIKFNIWEFVYFICYIFCFFAWTYNDKFALFLIIFIITIFLYLKEKYNIRKIQAALGIIYAFLICAILQLISGFLVECLYEYYDNTNSLKIVIGVLSCCFSLFVYYRFSVQDIINIVKCNINIILFCFLFIAFFIYLKIDIYKSQTLDIAFYVFLFLTILIAFNGIIIEQKYTYEIEVKNLEMQMNKVYSQNCIDLINKIRIRQHDFKNQLAVIQSMHLTATTLEELVDMQKGYINLIENEKNYDYILMSCNNPILSGYLYNMCLEYESAGIIFKPSVKIHCIDTIPSTYKITEILGALLNNAYEHVCINSGRKEIRLNILQNDIELTIDVSNPSKYIPYVHIENMFKLGYSTKGEERGIGLYSVKNIVNELNGFIIAENETNKDNNWFVIKITIPLDK